MATCPHRVFSQTLCKPPWPADSHLVLVVGVHCAHVVTRGPTYLPLLPAHPADRTISITSNMLELRSSEHCSASSSQPQARPSLAGNGVSVDHAEMPGGPERDAGDAERQQQQHGGAERRQLHRDVSLGIGWGGVRTANCCADRRVDGGREEGSGEAVTPQGAAAALVQQQGGDALAPGDGGRQGMTGRAVREWAQGAGGCKGEEDSAEGAYFPAPMLRVMPDLRPSSCSAAAAAVTATATVAVTANACVAAEDAATASPSRACPQPPSRVASVASKVAPEDARANPTYCHRLPSRMAFDTSKVTPEAVALGSPAQRCPTSRVASFTSKVATEEAAPGSPSHSRPASRMASFTIKVAPEEAIPGSPTQHHPASRMASFTSKVTPEDAPAHHQPTSRIASFTSKVASEDRPASPTHNRPSSRVGSFTSRVVSFTSRVASFTSRQAFEDAPARPTHRHPSSKALDGGSGSGSDGTGAAAAAEVKKHVPLKERLAKALSLSRHT